MYDILKHDFLSDIPFVINIIIITMFLLTGSWLNTIIVSDYIFVISVSIVGLVAMILLTVNYRCMRWVDNKMVEKENNT